MDRAARPAGDGVDVIGVVGWSAIGLGAATLAGLAVFWAVGAPGWSLRRLAPRRPWSSRLGRLGPVLAGRSDAPALPRRLMMAAVGVAATALVATTTLGAPPGPVWAAVPLLTVAATVGLGWLEPLASRRRYQLLVLQVPQALELLAAALAAGMPVRVAGLVVADAFDGPVAEDLRQVLAETELGVSDVEAWRGLSRHPLLGPAALDLARSVESGTRMVDSLRQHAQVAREHRQAALQVAARAVGVRSVMPLMICFIPSFMLLGVVPTVVSAVSHALQ